MGGCFDPAIGVEATEERTGVLQNDSLELVDISFEFRIVSGVISREIVVAEEDERSVDLAGRALL